MIPWDEYESQYSDLFKSKTGNVAKPFRMALGARIIQMKYDCSDRELVEQNTENPYLQYFIGLPHFQYDPPFYPSLMVAFRKRIDLDVSFFLNEEFLKKHNGKKSHHWLKRSEKYMNNISTCMTTEHTQLTTG